MTAPPRIKLDELKDHMARLNMPLPSKSTPALIQSVAEETALLLRGLASRARDAGHIFKYSESDKNIHESLEWLAKSTRNFLYLKVEKLHGLMHDLMDVAENKPTSNLWWLVESKYRWWPGQDEEAFRELWCGPKGTMGEPGKK